MKIKFYKLRNDYWIWWSGFKYDKGRIFIQWWNPKKGWVTNLLATPTKIHRWSGGFSSLLEEMKKDRQIDEITFMEIEKLRSHWNKELREILNTK